MVLTYHEAEVMAAQMVAVATAAKALRERAVADVRAWEAHELRIEEGIIPAHVINEEILRIDGVPDTVAAAVLEAVGYADLLGEVERLRTGIERLDLDVLEDVAYNFGHTVYDATELEPAECTDECEACCIEDTVGHLRALLDGAR